MAKTRRDYFDLMAHEVMGLTVLLFCESLQLHHRKGSFALPRNWPKDTSAQDKISPSLKTSNHSLLEKCFCNAGGGEEKRYWEKKQRAS